MSLVSERLDHVENILRGNYSTKSEYALESDRTFVAVGVLN